MKKKHWTTLGLALGVLVLGMLVGLMAVGTVAADPTPGVKIQLPRIDVGDVLGTGLWETWIQVQNVSIDDTDTGAIFLGWGDYSGLCPTNDPGVIVHYCQVIRGNAIWTLKTQLATDTKSAIIYTVDTDVYQEACQAAEETEGDKEAWRCWLEEWEFGTCEDDGGGWNAGPGDAFGEEVAVTATRYGPNDSGTFVSSTYTGISREMEGDDSAPYEYYAPYVMKGYNGLDTELTIQNSGEACTSVWIDYMEQGGCAIVYKHHVEQLAPGEAIRLRVPCTVDQIPCGWLGSAHISAEQPLGIIVDETSFDVPCLGVDRGTLLTHRARPKEEFRDGEPIEDTKVYADLIFREWSGWDASIQVQNLSRTGQHTFVTVDFLDNSGDEILFLADWVCPTGSTTFYLPIVTDLLPGYVGAAEIESHDQVAFPGQVTPAQPIFAVVDLKKPDNPLTPEMDAQGGSYNAHPYSQKEWVSQIALPFMAKDAYGTHPWTSMIAIRNNSNCNKIKPEIHFKDETGTVVCEIQSFWLRPKHVKLFDLDNIGCLYPGYIGAAKVYVDEFEQLCDVDQDGYVENEPLMPSVIVVERGILGLPYGGGGVTALADTWGDITSIYEGIPYATNIPLCYGEVFGEVSVRQEHHGFDRAEINGALVSVWDFDPLFLEYDTTDSTGGYQITDVPSGTHFVTVSKTDFFTRTTLATVECGEETLQDVELICQSTLNVTVTDTASNPIPGATVTVTGTYEYNADTEESKTDISDLTDNAGQVTMKVAGATTVLTATATAPGHDPFTITELGYPDLTTYNDHCGDTESLDFVPPNGLCKWNTIVGTVKIGGQWAEGYRLDAVDMSVNPPAVVDSDTTTALGVFSLENFSDVNTTYRINLYSPSDNFVSTTNNFDVNRCGGTAVITYTSGTWDGLTPLVWTGGTP